MQAGSNEAKYTNRNKWRYETPMNKHKIKMESKKGEGERSCVCVYVYAYVRVCVSHSPTLPLMQHMASARALFIAKNPTSRAGVDTTTRQPEKGGAWLQGARLGQV